MFLAMAAPQVPLVNLDATDGPLTEELVAAARACISATAYIGGPPVEQFEAAMAERLGVRHAVGLNSGTDALALALIGAGVSPGHGVVVPAFTYNATAAAVVRAGATPVFCDVDPETLNMDPQALASTAAAASHVQAAIPVHLFGHPADMVGCAAAAEASGIALVEDACQAIGATLDGQPAGALGDAAAFSFYPTKNLGGCGDGGLLTTNDDAIARTARVLRNQGTTPGGDKYLHEQPGWNSRLDALQAALLLVKLPHLDAWNASRRAVAERYRVGLAELGDAVRLPPGDGTARPVYHLFSIRADRRDDLRAHLTAAGIGTAIYYPIPVHAQECWGDLGYRLGDFPVAEQVCGEILSLPCWPGLPADAQDRVIDAVRAFYRGA